MLMASQWSRADGLEEMTAAAYSTTNDIAFAQTEVLTLTRKQDEPVTLDAPIRDLLYNADGSVLAAAMDDGSLRILAAAATGEESARLEGFEDVAANLQFDPTGGSPRSGQSATESGAPVEIPPTPTEQVVLPGQYPYAFSADGSLFAIKSDDQQIAIRVVDEILEREEDEILIQLEGHLAPDH